MKLDHFTNFQGKGSSQIVLIKPLVGTSGGFVIKSMYIKNFKKKKKNEYTKKT